MSSRSYAFAMAAAAIAGLLVCASVGATRAEPNGPEPIAYIGHGGFFDHAGNQITPTPEFIARAQAWYRSKLLKQVPGDSSALLKSFQSRLSHGLSLQPQERLIVQQRSLVWLAEAAPSGTVELRTLGKLRALDYRLRLSLPDDGKSSFLIKPFKMNPELQRRLDTPPVTSAGGPGTTTSGKDYEKECAAAGVPIPPPIGQMDPAGQSGWKSQGFIPQDAQFIVGSPAELRSYENASGMCFALPRYTDDTKTTVALDGVICLSKTTSKTCIWDNQMNGKGFPFPAGAKIPIGAPDLVLNPEGKYQAGGKELEDGSGGVCTECHAGENPYVVHPKASLGGGILMGKLAVLLPTFSPDRYQPLVAGTWPQNAASEPDADVPTPCGACHTQGDTGGRLPAVETNLGAYCGTILSQAIEKTMPPSNPGTLKADPQVVAFLAKCMAAAPPSP